MRKESVFEELTSQLEKKLFGIDSQIKKLAEILEKFYKSGQGDSAFIYGPRSCGKTDVITKVTARYVDNMEIVFIDGRDCSNDAAALRILSESDVNMRPHVIVLLNFEFFISRSKQIVVYKILNATRSLPMLALCVSCQLDAVDLLEKRARSRLSNISVSFCNPESTINDFHAALHYFLHSDSNDNAAKSHNKSLLEFLKNKQVKDFLERIYSEKGCNYDILKLIVATFLCFLKADGITSICKPECVPLFVEAVKTIVPTEEAMLPTISGLTLRQLCILTCCIRLMRNSHQLELVYNKIALDFRKFTHEYLSTLEVEDDVIVYKELDTLCDLGILEQTSCSGSLTFKKAILQVESDLILDCLKTYTPLPPAIIHWVDELH